MSQSAFVRPGASAAQMQRESDARRRSSWRTWLIGRPLSTADAPHQAIGKAVGLAVFSSDALSSTAYATQEILIILAMAGTAALSLRVPDLDRDRRRCSRSSRSPTSRRSTPTPAAAAPTSSPATTSASSRRRSPGAALLMDYILTVAVSISSGVAQIVSAFPALFALPRGARGRARGLRDVRQPARRQGVRASSSRCRPTSSSAMMFLTVGHRASSAS